MNSEETLMRIFACHWERESGERRGKDELSGGNAHDGWGVGSVELLGHVKAGSVMDQSMQGRAAGLMTSSMSLSSLSYLVNTRQCRVDTSRVHAAHVRVMDRD